MLATALASLLMILILTISTRVRATLATTTALDPSSLDVLQVESLLQRDLALAEKVECDEKTISIVGYGRLDQDTQDPRQGPTRVVYSIMPIGGGQALVRQQKELDSRTNRESQLELVLWHVTAFAMEPAQPEPQAEAPSPSTTQPAESKAANYWMTLAIEGSPPIRKLLVVE